MTHKESPNDMPQSDADEISLADILGFVRENLKVIAALAVAGAVIGIGSTYAIQKQWEGKVTLQVGRSAGSPVSGPDGPLIESVQQTVGRITLGSFRDRVAGEVLPDLRQDQEALRKTVAWKSLKARGIQGTVYVEVTARGTSEAEAEKMLKQASEDVILEHQAILDRARLLPKQQLSVIDAAIDANTKAQDELTTALARSKNTDSVMALSALQSSRSERAVLNDSRFRVSQLLAPDQSYNTRVISAINVNGNPVFPRKLYFGGGGLVIGALLGVLLGLARKLKASVK
ncbi:hypothetical protein U875_02315 [Pandoraea pnomenusa 3kgm]|nr:hypothetical protein U875_02315 [Pandoraea pnomenusa 3kgm]